SLQLTALFPAEVTETIVAIVNDDIITQAELDMIIFPVYAQLETQYKGRELDDQLDKAARRILNEMIEDRLIVQEAKAKNIKVDESDVEALVDELRGRFEAPEEFETLLDGRGMSMEDLKQKYREQLMARRLLNSEVYAKVFVSPSEVDQYYREHEYDFVEPEAVNVQNILIRTEHISNVEALSKIQAILKELDKGGDFTELAQKYSEGPNASKGGDMDFVAKGQLRKELDKAAFELKPGEYSSFIRTDLGYHIIKVSEHRQARVVPLDEVRKSVEDVIFKQKSQDLYKQWMEKLKKDAYIAIKIK
ncbi:MAG: peptidylprolyl isomerase, partial [Candidatus Omnitrophota bacterium]